MNLDSETKNTLINGITEIKELCEKCIAMLSEDKYDTCYNEIDEIIGETIPDKSEALFKVILQLTHPELVQ